ncbi:hypothetical protein Tco_1004376 [Tanacetum coccineum]|uniref:Reverse transcriptase domain-containing protein n=1 Tax=Tanacetum coccineum TaxID=301880 RepID=A0ABQ5FD66_9ASTR
MDRGGGDGIQTNEKIDSGVAYVNGTKRERGINHLPGGCKGSHTCSPNDGKRRETNQERQSRDKEELLDPWTLFTDGSSCIDGSRAGLILTNLEGAEFTYALRFRFDTTNNEA